MIWVVVLRREPRIVRHAEAPSPAKNRLTSKHWLVGSRLMAAPDQSSRGPAGTKSAVWQTLLFTGGALAIVAAAAFYVVLGAPSPGEILARLRGEPAIARGFIGMANFGHWRLICIAGPAPLNGLTPPAAGSDTPKAATSRANACRINQEMPAPQDKADAGSQPAKVLIATNFSLIGAKRTPAAMLRLDRKSTRLNSSHIPLSRM